MEISHATSTKVVRVTEGEKTGSTTHSKIRRRFEKSAGSKTTCVKFESPKSQMSLTTGKSSTSSLPLMQSIFNGNLPDEVDVGAALGPSETKSTSSCTTLNTAEHKCAHRVLISTACYNVIDGVTLTIRKIEAAILNAGGHVCILTTKSGNEANTNLNGVHRNRRIIFLDDAVKIPFLEDGKDSDDAYYLGVKISNDVRRKLDGFEATIIHLTATDCVGLDVIQYARDNEIPLMGTYHSNVIDYLNHYSLSFLKPFLGPFFTHQYSFLQHLYVPTPFAWDFVTDHFQLDRYTNLNIWGRGIDLENFSPKWRCNKFRKKLGILPSEVVICFVGRLVFEKRPDIFANVIRRLHGAGVSFKALVVGVGPYYEEMRKLPNTICMGWSRGEELSVAYASSDIFLFPGALETFGNVTLEAAASGLPLIVESECSGHLVRDGVSGFACPNGDEDAFFNATITLVHNQKLREGFSVKSREHSFIFENEKILSQMLKNYADVTAEFHAVFDGKHDNRKLVLKRQGYISSKLGPIVFPFSLRITADVILHTLTILNFFVNMYRSGRLIVRNILGRVNLVGKNWLRQEFIQQRVDSFLFLFLGHKKPIEESTSLARKSISSEISQSRSASAAPSQDIVWIRTIIEWVASVVIFNIWMQGTLQKAMQNLYEMSCSRKQGRETRFNQC